MSGGKPSLRISYGTGAAPGTAKAFGRVSPRSEAHWLKDARAPGAMKFKWFLPVLQVLALDGKLRGSLTLDSKAGQSR